MQRGEKSEIGPSAPLDTDFKHLVTPIWSGFDLVETLILHIL